MPSSPTSTTILGRNEIHELQKRDNIEELQVDSSTYTKDALIPKFQAISTESTASFDITINRNNAHENGPNESGSNEHNADDYPNEGKEEI